MTISVKPQQVKCVRTHGVQLVYHIILVSEIFNMSSKHCNRVVTLSEDYRDIQILVLFIW